jgi:hypothetical protein
MTKKRMQIIIGAAVIILVGAGAFWLSLSSHIPTPAESLEPVATTTPEEMPLAPAAPVKKGLPVEPAFTLPEDATAVDDYAFLVDDTVYFRSLTSVNPLAIPNSDAGSFEKLTPFMTYQGSAIVKDCGASGTYGYYADDGQVYFYQFWRAPEFRSSRIEVIVGAKKKDFEVTGPLTAEDRKHEFSVAYRQAATSTCEYYLNRTDR